MDGQMNFTRMCWSVADLGKEGSRPPEFCFIEQNTFFFHVKESEDLGANKLGTMVGGGGNPFKTYSATYYCPPPLINFFYPPLSVFIKIYLSLNYIHKV